MRLTQIVVLTCFLVAKGERLCQPYGHHQGRELFDAAYIVLLDSLALALQQADSFDSPLQVLLGFEFAA